MKNWLINNLGYVLLLRRFAFKEIDATTEGLDQVCYFWIRGCERWCSPSRRIGLKPTYQIRTNDETSQHAG
jgi:hypothetical protein